MLCDAAPFLSFFFFWDVIRFVFRFSIPLRTDLFCFFFRWNRFPLQAFSVLIWRWLAKLLAAVAVSISIIRSLRHCSSIVFFCPRKRLYRPPLINGGCVSDLVILSSFVSFNFDANACYALRYDNLGISTLPLFVWYRKQSFLQMNGNDLNVYIHEVISIACSFVFLLLLEEFLSLN